jgi:hypothetical protein
VQFLIRFHHWTDVVRRRRDYGDSVGSSPRR